MRYIEIDSIIEQIKSEHCDSCSHYRCTLCDIDEVLILLEEADDADVVEVVRCKDCVSLNYATDGSFCYCGHRSGLKYFVEADDFCSCGEKRDGVI